MTGPLKTERLDARDPSDLQRAADLLRAGETVAFPTETVYGLGANALDPAALEKIFTAKQRPHWDPLIVHLADRDQLGDIAHATPLAERLMSSFWPGPLTLLLPRTAAVPDAVTAGRALVGVRIPAHPVARSLLQQAGIPIAAPSANTFGHTSPTTAEHVLDDLDGRIAAVLDGGATTLGLESTVLELTDRGVRVYRPGAVTLLMLREVAGHAELFVPQPSDAVAPQALPSPGVGLRHYAPRARVLLVEDASLVAAVEQAQVGEGSVGVLLPDGWDSGSAQHVFRWGAWDNLEQLAARLFTGLRLLDDSGAGAIVVPLPPGGGLGDALRDRLLKAARQS